MVFLQLRSWTEGLHGQLLMFIPFRVLSYVNVNDNVRLHLMLL